jgi:hypothetical protein
MGALSNILVGSSFAVGLLAIALAAPVASADEPEETLSLRGPVSPVSTSPETPPAPEVLEGPAPRRASSPTVRLTRAAAQLYVDQMSPLGWLSSYGHVVVGRSD